jgi:hypothetical protein
MPHSGRCGVRAQEVGRGRSGSRAARPATAVHEVRPGSGLRLPLSHARCTARLAAQASLSRSRRGGRHCAARLTLDGLLARQRRNRRGGDLPQLRRLGLQRAALSL